MASIHDYKTGEYVREASESEYAAYLAEIADDRTGTGAVDGERYGCSYTIYMED